MKHPFAIYAGLECLLKKVSICHNNLEKSSSSKKYEHTRSAYSIFTHFSCDTTKNKLDRYGDKDCIKRFCNDLKEHATKILNYEKKEMIP